MCKARNRAIFEKRKHSIGIRFSQMDDEARDSPDLSLIFCNSLLVGIFLSAFVANLLVLVVFYKKSGLRSTANRFVVNLMGINLVSCTSLLPLSLADNSIISSNKVLCVATELSSVFCSSAIIYAVLLIALDQYCGVVDPLHYHRIISSSKSNMMIFSSWCVSAVFAILDGLQPTIDKGEYSVFRHCGLPSDFPLLPRSNFSTALPTASESEFFIKNGISDIVRGSNHKINRYVFCTVYTFSVFVIPFLLICFIYYRICVAASGNTKRTRAGRSNAPEENAKGDPNEKSEYFTVAKDVEKRRSRLRGLRGGEINRPSFVVTRPSPPKDEPEEDEQIIFPNPETPSLKPTLKNNSSFSKLSSFHIQFSSETRGEEDRGRGRTRRHSNTHLPVTDPEFQNISITRSCSIHYHAESGASLGSRRTSRSSSVNSARQTTSRASSIRSTSGYIVHNIRHRISNASLFRYREEARATRISALVIVMALVCWLPFFTIFYLHSGTQMELISGRRSFPIYFDSFSIAFLLLSAVVSPFLFAFRNKKIKREIRKIVKCWKNDLPSDCFTSFYKYNLSMNSKSQRMHLFSDLRRDPAAMTKLNISLERINIPSRKAPS